MNTAETEPMGRVVTEALVENLEDLWAARKGAIPVEQVRRIRVSDALADTGATTLALPKRYIQQLGLQKQYEKRATSSAGAYTASVYDTVRLTIRDRTCAVDVVEVPDEELEGREGAQRNAVIMDKKAGRQRGDRPVEAA